MARLTQYTVQLNSIQLRILEVFADLFEQRAREPTSLKNNVTIYRFSEELPYHKDTIKKNIYKFKELKCS